MKKSIIVLIACLFISMSLNYSYAQSQDQATSLTMAILKGSSAEVKKILDSGVHPDIKTANKVSALMVAVQNDNLEIAKMLIAKGADVNKKDAYGKTILFHAYKAPMMRLLIENGANMYAEENHYTPYESYVLNRKVITEKEKNTNLQLIRNMKLNAAMTQKAIAESKKQWLTKQDIYDVVNLYEEKGYNPIKIKGKKDGARSIIFIAAMESNYEVLQAINNLNKYDFNGFLNDYLGCTILSTLTLNSIRSDAEYDILVTSLVKNGLRLDDIAIDMTPLMSATDKKNINRCKTLLKLGANPKIVNSKKRNVLFFAQTLPLTQLFVGAGVDINSRDMWNQTPLFGKESADVVRYYLSKGLKANEIDNDGETPLFRISNATTVKLLIDNGADVNHQNKQNISIIANDANIMTGARRYDIDLQDNYIPKYKILFTYRINKQNVEQARAILNRDDRFFRKTLTLIDSYLRR